LKRTAFVMAMLGLMALLGVTLAACESVIGGSGNNDHVTVQHILIAVSGASRVMPFRVTKQIIRTPEQAKARAEQLLKAAQQGQDFDKLVRENSDDAPPGIYSMSNLGVPAEPGEYPRANVPPNFAQTSFTLKPGEIGMSPYDASNNPAGYHIIKRVK
jgi:peptidyl-prolyl cis-trans isomerase D